MENKKHKMDDWSDYFCDAAASYKSNEEDTKEIILDTNPYDCLYDEPVVTLTPLKPYQRIQNLPEQDYTDYSEEAQLRMMQQQMEYAAEEYDQMVVSNALEDNTQPVIDVKAEEVIEDNAIEEKQESQHILENLVEEDVKVEYTEEPVVENKFNALEYIDTIINDYQIIESVDLEFVEGTVIEDNKVVVEQITNNAEFDNLIAVIKAYAPSITNIEVFYKKEELPVEEDALVEEMPVDEKKEDKKPVKKPVRKPTKKAKK